MRCNGKEITAIMQGYAVPYDGLTGGPFVKRKISTSGNLKPFTYYIRHECKIVLKLGSQTRYPKFLLLSFNALIQIKITEKCEEFSEQRSVIVNDVIV